MAAGVGETRGTLRYVYTAAVYSGEGEWLSSPTLSVCRFEPAPVGEGSEERGFVQWF